MKQLDNFDKNNEELDQTSFAATEVDSEQNRINRIMSDPIEELLKGSYKSKGQFASSHGTGFNF
jgi:hypothetical protein